MSQYAGRGPESNYVRLAEAFGLRRVVRIRPGADPELGSWVLETGRGRVAVRVHPMGSELELKRQLAFVSFLGQQGFPVYAPLADRTGRFWLRDETGLVTFHRLRAGSLSPLDPARVEHLAVSGRALAVFHQLARTYRKGSDFRWAPERSYELYEQLRNFMRGYHGRVQRTLDGELEYLLDALDPRLPRGPIFGEVYPRRFRFRHDRLELILGFDPNIRGPFLSDLASAVHWLCFSDGQFQAAAFEALVTNYDATRALSLAEWDAFPNELRFAAFRSTVLALRKLLGSHYSEAAEQEFERWVERLLILRREREGGLDPILRMMAMGYDYRRYQRARACAKRASRHFATS